MTTLQEKIDALPPWAHEVSLGGLSESPSAVDRDAALARLALAREVLAGCHCIGHETMDALLKALEGP